MTDLLIPRALQIFVTLRLGTACDPRSILAQKLVAKRTRLDACCCVNFLFCLAFLISRPVLYVCGFFKMASPLLRQMTALLLLLLSVSFFVLDSILGQGWLDRRP